MAEITKRTTECERAVLTRTDGWLRVHDLLRIDADGLERTWHGGLTVEQVRAAHPTAEVHGLAEAHEMCALQHVTAPARITGAEFGRMLEELPPDRWRRGLGAETFMSPERTYGEVTTIALRRADGCWAFQGSCRMTHGEIVARVEAAEAARAAEARPRAA